MNRDILPDTDHVSRYCKPTTIQDGRIMPAAFKFRDNETHLSVNWLEYLKAPNWDSAINMIREALLRKGFGIRRNGKFVVLNVGDIVKIIYTFSEIMPKVEHLPMEDDPSHSGISHYKTDALLEIMIERLVSNSSTYPGVVES